MFRFSPLGNVVPLVLTATLAILAGCTQGTSVTGSGPTGLSARTLSLTSVEVYWTRDPTDTTTDTVVVMNGTNVVTEIPSSFPLDSATAPGLTSGTPYKILIATKEGRSGSIPYTLYLPEVPSNLTATVLANSAFVSWTRFVSDTSIDTIIVTTPTGQLVETIVVPGNSSSGLLSGLPAGGTFVIIIATSAGRSSPITVTIAGPAFGISVNSLSSSSIGVKWSRAHGDTTADTIFAIQNGSVVQTLEVSNTSGVLTNLQEGVLTYISIHSFTGISDTIIWMTAERTNGLSLYEVDDISDPNVLQVGMNNTKTFPSMANPITGLVLTVDSTSPSQLTLKDSSANAQWDTIKMRSSGILVPGGLQNNYRSMSYVADTEFDTAHTYQLPSGKFDSTGSLMIEFKTANGHFGLIEIVPDSSTGQLFSVGSNGKRFVTMNISYQGTLNQPYAARGRRSFARPSRISAH